MIEERFRASLADRYRVERELGQGGMATVYLAADLKHDRQVAIKVLKPELAAVLGAERFLAEIKTTAHLQHPHILPLHDSGEVDGTVFYVMPFIDGETVRSRLDHEKQLPVPEAIHLATEVAAALDYAHRQGVIHRDIKPENILLHDGSALVADFGIALAASKIGGSRITETGISLGTPHYMSPEQALGEREITARSDVYALGCVLYEMLTGEPPFTGPTAQAIIAKLMTDDPRPPAQLRKTIPPHIEAATLTALARLPADRFASAAAFAEALANPAYRSGGFHAIAPARAGRSAWSRWGITTVAGIAIGAIGTGLALRPRKQTSAWSQAPLQITFSGRAGSPAISPDGRFVAFLERRCPAPPAPGGCANLEVLEVGSTSPVEVVTGADRLDPPRWTHDGLSVVVAGSLGSDRSGLYVVPRLGGTPRRIGDEPSAYDTHPSADSVLMVFDTPDSADLRMTSIADAPVPARGRRVPVTFRAVAWSPDARLIAGMSYSGEVYVLSRDGSTLSSAPVVYGRNQLRWSTDGRYLILFHGGSGVEDYLSAFPVGSDGTLGALRPLPLQLRTEGAGRFDVARTSGRLVVGTSMETFDVWSFEFGGPVDRERRLTQGTNWYGPPVPGGDGHTVYYLRADALGDNLYALAGGRERALTGEQMFVDNSVRLSLDGRQVSFEALIGEQAVLAIYDVLAGTTRRIAKPYRATGWQVRSGQIIVWLDVFARTAWTTDSAGDNRHPLSLPPIGVLDKNGGGWALAPDGSAVAVLGSRPDGYAIVRIPLDGGPATALRDIQATAIERAAGTSTITGQYQAVGVGLAGWGRDGIYLSRGAADGRETELLVLDPVTRAMRKLETLPERCVARSVTVASDERSAVCTVEDVRTDLTVIDGLKP